MLTTRKKVNALLFKASGTFCPSCGHQQPHTHLGWIEIGKILLTDLKCKQCGHNSTIIRFTDDRRKQIALLMLDLKELLGRARARSEPYLGP